MLKRLLGKKKKKRTVPREEDWLTEEDIDENLGARSGREEVGNDDVWQPPDMADGLGQPRPVLDRGTQNTRPQRNRRRRDNQRHHREREAPTRPPVRQQPERLIEGGASHGSYDSAGSVQRGVDMFRPGGPTPDTFMPHLAAHAKYTHHLTLPYDMSHIHASMYEGAPLIRGFPAHDRILEAMQRTNAENYPGRDFDDDGGWEEAD